MSLLDRKIFWSPPPKVWAASALALTLVLSGCVSAFEAGQNASGGNNSSQGQSGSSVPNRELTNVSVAVTKIWKFPESQFSTPEKDYLLAVDLEILNESDEDVSVSSLLSFALMGVNGKTYSLSVFAEVDSRLDGTVKPGRKLVGTLVYDVDKNTDFYLTFKPSLLDDEIEFEIGQPGQS